MSVSLYTMQSKNVWKTWLYMSFFVLLFAIVGFTFAFYYQNVNIFYFAIILSLIMNLFSFWYSDKIALHMAGARKITKSEYPEFWNIAENLAITAGLPTPKLYVIDDPIPNAFATGRDKNHSAIAATTGLLSMLNKAELEGVVAHEMSHIGNRDILLSTIVVIMVSAISFLSQIFFRSRFFNGERDRENGGGGIMIILSFVAIILAPIAATIIQFAISRKREFLADSSGALLTRYPEGLASALQKISQFHQPLKNANNATAHMYIINPMGLNSDNDNKEEKISWFTKIFMTHPPTKDRIKALMGEK